MAFLATREIDIRVYSLGFGVSVRVVSLACIMYEDCSMHGVQVVVERRFTAGSGPLLHRILHCTVERMH